MSIAENIAQVREEIAGVSRLVFHAPFNELFPSAIDPRAVQLAHDRLVQAANICNSVRRMVLSSVIWMVRPLQTMCS